MERHRPPSRPMKSFNPTTTHASDAFQADSLEEETKTITEVWHQHSLAPTVRSLQRRAQSVAGNATALARGASTSGWLGAAVLALTALLCIAIGEGSENRAEPSPSARSAGYLYIDLDEAPGQSPEHTPPAHDPQIATLDDLPLVDAEETLDLATIEAIDEEERQKQISERTRRTRIARWARLQKRGASSRPKRQVPAAKSKPTPDAPKIQLDASDPWAD